VIAGAQAIALVLLAGVLSHGRRDAGRPTAQG